MADGINIPLDIEFSSNIKSVEKEISKSTNAIAADMRKITENIGDNTNSAIDTALAKTSKAMSDYNKTLNTYRAKAAKVGKTTYEYAEAERKQGSAVFAAQGKEDAFYNRVAGTTAAKVKDSLHLNEQTALLRQYEKELNSVEAAVAKLKKNMDAGGKSGSASANLLKNVYEPRMQALKEDIALVQSNIAEINNLVDRAVKDAVDAASKTEQAKALRNEVIQAQTEIHPEDYAQFGSETQLTTLSSAMDSVIQKQEKLQNAVLTTNQVLEDNKYTDSYTQLQTEIDKVVTEIEKLTAKKAELDFKEANANQYQNLAYKIKLATDRLTELIEKQKEFDRANIFRSSATPDAEITNEVNATEGRLAQTQEIANNLQNSVNTATSKAADGIRKVNREITNTGRSAKQASGPIKRFFSYFVRYALRRALFQAIRNLGKAMKESFAEMAKQIPEINAQMSSFKTALNQTKGSLGTAFQPIVSAVLPLLTKLLNMINTVLNAIGRFTAALTGQGYVYEFVANQANYAAESTGKAAKAMKKSLAGFDEINQLGSDSSGGGGDSGGGGTYKKVAINTDEADFASQLREKIEADDWRGVGEVLANKVNEALYLDWRAIARELAAKLSGVVKNALDIAIGFVETLDWMQLGQDIWDALVGFVEGTDWGGITARIFELLGASLGGLGATILSFCDGIYESIIEGLEEAYNKYMAPYLDDAGHMTVEGFFQGILDWLFDIAVWVNEHITQPFINGVKKALGIASPSKVMEELAKYTIQGFLNGILSMWEKVKTWWSNTKTSILNKVASIKEGILNKFSDFATRLKTVFQSAWQKVKEVFSTGGKIFTGIKEGIENTFKTIVNALIRGINKIVSTPFNAINNMLNKIRNVSVLGMAPFQSLWGQNPLKVPQIPQLATGSVVPPNKEFLALLGDNKKETEIVSPLSTMKQALLEALNESNSSSGIDNITIYLSTSEVTRAIIKQINGTTKQTGSCPIKLKA